VQVGKVENSQRFGVRFQDRHVEAAQREEVAFDE
jgi:hypothetical protein